MSSVASPPRPHAPRHRHRRRAMHGGPWACSKRALCCSAFAVLTMAGCAALSTTCTTRGCARQHGKLGTQDDKLWHAPASCGRPPLPHNRSIPNVLLVGDSISMGRTIGYGWAAKHMLESVGMASVQHNGGWEGDAGQAGPSSKGVACLEYWLGTERWDVIHLNHGLHDVAKARGGTWKGVRPAQYVKNLDWIYKHVRRALVPGGQFIWASTTPMPHPSGIARRNNTMIVQYNELAAALWRRKPPGSVVTNDLYGLITRRCGSDSAALGAYRSCALQRLWPKPAAGDVHFNEQGQHYLALAVAGVISQHLPLPRANEIEAGATSTPVDVSSLLSRMLPQSPTPSARPEVAFSAPSGRSHSTRVAAVLSANDTRWHHARNVLQSTGAFAHIVRHIPPTPTAAIAGVAPSAQLQALMRKSSCQRIQSNLIGFGTLLRRMAAHRSTAASEWLYVFEDDIDIVPRYREDASAVQAMLAATERHAARRNVSVLLGGLGGALECQSQQRSPVWDCAGLGAHAFAIRVTAIQPTLRDVLGSILVDSKGVNLQLVPFDVCAHTARQPTSARARAQNTPWVCLGACHRPDTRCACDGSVACTSSHARAGGFRLLRGRSAA